VGSFEGVVETGERVADHEVGCWVFGGVETVWLCNFGVTKGLGIDGGRLVLCFQVRSGKSFNEIYTVQVSPSFRSPQVNLSTYAFNPPTETKNAVDMIRLPGKMRYETGPNVYLATY